LEHETQQSKQAKEIETSTTTPRLAQQLNTQFLRLPFLIAARLAASAVRASKAAALWCGWWWRQGEEQKAQQV